MFGIGLPELIVILGLALIIVGPDKLPELARSIAKGVMELKKTAEGLKDELTQEGGMLEDLRPDIDAVKKLKNDLAESTHVDWQNNKPIDTPYTVKDIPNTTENEAETKEIETPPPPSAEDAKIPVEDKDPTPADYPKPTIKDEKQTDDAGKKP